MKFFNNEKRMNLLHGNYENVKFTAYTISYCEVYIIVMHKIEQISITMRFTNSTLSLLNLQTNRKIERLLVPLITS